ncbi:MAG: hypothetical protein NTU53_21185 [Planctomycetota bacterium]|nr:hypothetical protein [Planctomycetota bacterium]
MRVMVKVCAVMAVLMFTGIASAQKDAASGKGKGQMLDGRVVKVEEGKMTVASGKGDKAKETAVATSDKTQVLINGLPGKLADLKAGQVVRVTQASDTATRIQADDNLLIGEVVKAEDAKLTVHVGGQKGQDVVVATSDKAEVLVNGAAGKLADLKAGQMARISRADEKATRIEASDKPAAVTKSKADKVGK